MIETTTTTDQATREYMEGWNACNRGKWHYDNPYLVDIKSMAKEQWQKGWIACQWMWDNSDSVPASYGPTQLELANKISSLQPHEIWR